ncbi:I78 family peptidase inhibitor [Maricaulis sp.]|uniref:I78 family peptidase inhibitor n=1 Tax=Maricaulis sp. TaxID=1486257 RepID=UPI003A8DBF99
MKSVSILLGGLLLTGCAFDLSPAPRQALPTLAPVTAPARPAVAGPASDMPAMGEIQDIGTARFQRPITGSCGMESLQHYVGQPRVAVDSRTLPENYRVVGRYSRVTMEYIPERLTIRIADDDTVESLTCG